MNYTKGKVGTFNRLRRTLKTHGNMMIQMIGLYTRHAGYWDEDTLCTGPVADADDGDDEWDTTNHDKYEDEDYEYVDGIEKHDVTPQL